MPRLENSISYFTTAVCILCIYLIQDSLSTFCSESITIGSCIRNPNTSYSDQIGWTPWIFSVKGMGLLGSASALVVSVWVGEELTGSRKGSVPGSSSQYEEENVGARREMTRTSPPEQNPASPMSLHMSRFRLNLMAFRSTILNSSVCPRISVSFGMTYPIIMAMAPRRKSVAPVMSPNLNMMAPHFRPLGRIK